MKHEILELASEDWTGLHEVLGCVQACMPGRTVDEQMEVAKRFVHVMIAHGLVELWYVCIVSGKGASKRVGIELTKEEKRREMNDRSNWLHGPRPTDERWVAIALTPAGEGRVFQGKLPDY